MAKKDKKDIVQELQHGVDQNGRSIMIDLVDSAVQINGANDIVEGDPEEAGQLFLTGSEALGGTAGFNVICISEG